MHYLMDRYTVSARRACRVVQTTRSSVYYTSRHALLTSLRQRMREFAQTRVRHGYRRLRVLMQREGWPVGTERFYRVYTEEGLALRRKRPWRHVTAVYREQRRAATAYNDIWRMNFVADQLADGRRFRARTVIDMFARECLAIDIGHGLGGTMSPPRVSDSDSNAVCRNVSTATTARSSSVRRWTSGRTRTA